MRTIALCGFSEKSRGPVYSLPDTVEIWSVNHAYTIFDRIDRLYELHSIELIMSDNYYQKDYQQGYWDYLKAEHDYPIFMQQAYPEIPAARRYPIEQAAALGGPDFTSSFPYMMAAAMLEGVDRIELYGFDMQAGTEYAYQRQEALNWIWFARGKGFDVYVPPNCGLFERHRMYGYEGVQMVGRQTLEIFHNSYLTQFETAKATMHQWAGIVKERQTKQAPADEINSAYLELRKAENQAAYVDGAIKAVEDLLERCDLVEVEPYLTLEEVMEGAQT